MSNPKGKAAFVASQPAAAISALDFAASAEAFRASLTHDKPGIEATDLADVIAERADRVISTPAHTPAQIADKLSAYAWLHGLPHDLANPTTQAAIAASNRDDAKGLLAIYLDLTATPDRSEWDAAIARCDEARAASAATEDDDEADDDSIKEVRDAHSLALENLLNTTAPDAAAMAAKARAVIAYNHIEYAADEPDNPAMLQRMCNGPWEEHFAAVMYRDALYLAGDRGPVATLRPEPFSADEWSDKAEADTGLPLGFDGQDVTLGDKPAGEVYAPWQSLADWQRQLLEAEGAFRERQREREARTTTERPRPVTEGELQALFVNGLLASLADDQRPGVADALQAAGVDITYPPGVAFDPAAFMSDLFAADMTVLHRQSDPDTLSLLYRGPQDGEDLSDQAGARKVMALRFDRLRPEHRAALAAHLTVTGQ